MLFNLAQFWLLFKKLSSKQGNFRENASAKFTQRLLVDREFERNLVGGCADVLGPPVVVFSNNPCNRLIRLPIRCKRNRQGRGFPLTSKDRLSGSDVINAIATEVFVHAPSKRTSLLDDRKSKQVSLAGLGSMNGRVRFGGPLILRLRLNGSSGSVDGWM